MNTGIKVLVIALIVVAAAALALFTSYMMFVRSKSVEATIEEINPPSRNSPLRREPVYTLKVSYINPKDGTKRFAYVEKPAPVIESEFTYKVGDKLRIML